MVISNFSFSRPDNPFTPLTLFVLIRIRCVRGLPRRLLFSFLVILILFLLNLFYYLFFYDSLFHIRQKEVPSCMIAIFSVLELPFQYSQNIYRSPIMTRLPVNHSFLFYLYSITFSPSNPQMILSIRKLSAYLHVILSNTSMILLTSPLGLAIYSASPHGPSASEHAP